MIWPTSIEFDDNCRHFDKRRPDVSKVSVSVRSAHAARVKSNHYGNKFQFIARFLFTAPNEPGNGSGLLCDVFIHGFGLW